MTTMIAWFLWIGLLVALVLLVVDIIATAVAIKVLRHIEVIEEVHQTGVVPPGGPTAAQHRQPPPPGT